MNTTAANIIARRVIAQRIAQHPLRTPGALVARLGAIQAQEYAASKWAVGLRLRDGAFTDADIEQELAKGSIVRTHALRGTWQLIASEDVRWILALISARLIASNARRYRELELDPITFRRSHATLRRCLRGGKHRTRAELAAALADAGISASGQRFAYLLQHAELDAVVCNGARRGKQPTYALLDERVPKSRPPTRDRMLAELARRYFQSRGPATLADFTWWSGLAAAEARAALEAVQSELASEVLRDRTYFRGRTKSVRLSSPAAHLLPAFDEYLVAYGDRSAALDAEHAERINAGGGLLAPSIVLDGRVIGIWRRVLSRTTVALDLGLFDVATARQKRAILDAAERYGRFVGLEVSTTFRRA